MSDFNFTVPDRAELAGSEPRDVPIARKLVMRPESFFSHRFHLEAEGVENDSDEDSGRDVEQTGLMRLIDINIVLLIVLIGIPVLVISVLSAL